MCNCAAALCTRHGLWASLLLAWDPSQAAVVQEADEEEEVEEETEEESSLSEALEGVHVGDEVASAARQLSKKQQALVGCSHFALSLHVAGHRSAVN